MALNAEFQVNGDAAVQAHEVAYGAVVTLAALSEQFQTIAWSAPNTSKAELVAPTITTPTRATATFTWIADPGDGLGRAIAVRCRQTNAQGEEAISYRIIGTVNSQGVMPLVNDEERWRHATHGYIELINEALVAAGTGGGSEVVFGPALTDADETLTVAQGAHRKLSTATAIRTKTLGTSGATDGATITIWNESAFAITALNGGFFGGTVTVAVDKKTTFTFMAGEWVATATGDV